MATDQLVWFVLVDGQGEPYKGTTASSVDIPSNYVIDQFRKAVKAENPRKLSSFDASDLHVYSNKAAFDEGNSLGVGEKIENYGKLWTNPLLVVVPSACVQEIQPQMERQIERQLERQMERQSRLQIEAIRTILPHKSDKSYTDGALGQIEYARLKKDELIIDVAPIHNGEAFRSPMIQQQADAITNEAVFDAFITPFFNVALANCDMVFVNSERYQWLSQSIFVSKTTDLKPDGFAAHPGMFRAKQEPNDRVDRPTEHTFRFRVAEEELFDCLILFESKLVLTDAAFGQVVRYLQNLCPEASASAILFDRRSFWLIKSHKAVIVKVHKAKWVDCGSKSLFQNFIAANMSPWVAHLTNACLLLGVHAVEGDAYLGRGARGCVFKVIGHGEVFALKIVDERSAGSLYREEEALIIALWENVWKFLAVLRYCCLLLGNHCLDQRPDVKYETSLSCCGSST